ncbi:hypothetical protein PGTUg99_002071 [Puccinia graminis f. sp. tritici]|uniref:Uncharacterized protein n=1 Tax=Puccinia graminis f. sp. tritici TaxID=56615 RepID=A0A5B0MZQ1_PUCGR|nr:hypothetical protein PGTUg99_002071 [Puccinia graminis f. sp. tritici]
MCVGVCTRPGRGNVPIDTTPYDRRLWGTSNSLCADAARFITSRFLKYAARHGVDSPWAFGTASLREPVGFPTNFAADNVYQVQSFMNASIFSDSGVPTTFIAYPSGVAPLPSPVADSPLGGTQ